MIFKQSCPHIMMRLMLKTAQVSRMLQCVCVVNQITHLRHSYLYSIFVVLLKFYLICTDLLLIKKLTNSVIFHNILCNNY